MDRALTPRPRRIAWRAALVVSAVVAAGCLAAWRPSAVRTIATPQLAVARMGEFRDELALRGRVEPLRSVQLDAPEAGRVEAVLAHDGEVVAAGAPLYRLHSPEQEQLLMQRGAEVAQQMANVSVQRSALASSVAANRRELAQLQAAAQQAEADLHRQQQLAAAGFVSASALEQAERQQRLATALVEQARHDQEVEAETRRQSLDEMARAVQGLQHGLELLHRSRERLLQRAPNAGPLSGVQLQVGASVKPGDRLGRVDDPEGGVQLVAEVDEYHLPRLQPGLAASSPGGALVLAQTLPQVQAGKVRVLLRWADGVAPPPGLRPGQALELRLQLDRPSPALLLPEGPGVQAML